MAHEYEGPLFKYLLKVNGNRCYGKVARPAIFHEFSVIINVRKNHRLPFMNEWIESIIGHDLSDRAPKLLWAGVTAFPGPVILG